MPQLSRHLLCAALLNSLSAIALSAQTVTRNLPYTTDPTGTYRADLYQPSTAGPHPAIVMIHGGSWRSGHKTEFHKLGSDLAAHGYTCFSIDYDTHPHSFPSSWQESRAAIAFLRDHTAEYGIDPARIAVLGSSAGSQLAALLALAPEGPAPAQTSTPTIPVAAAVVFNGVYNLRVDAYVLRRYLGGRCDRIPHVCTDASPDIHIHPGAPPFFVGHGTADHVVPYQQAIDFTALLQAAGNPVTPFRASGAGHSYWKGHMWYAANLAAVEAFLAATMPPSS